VGAGLELGVCARLGARVGLGETTIRGDVESAVLILGVILCVLDNCTVVCCAVAAWRPAPAATAQAFSRPNGWVRHIGGSSLFDVMRGAFLCAFGFYPFDPIAFVTR
jgi:hypothetical protein